MKKLVIISLSLLFLVSNLLSQSDMTDYEKFISTPNTLITKTVKHINDYPAKPLPYSIYLIKVIKNSQPKIFVKILTPKYSSTGKLTTEWYSGIYPIEELKSISLNVNKFLAFLSNSVPLESELLFTTTNGLIFIVINNQTKELLDADKKRALIEGKKYDPESGKYIHIYLDKERSYLPLEIRDFDSFKKMFDDIFNAASSF